MILKIKNKATGEWVEITSIKGEPGKTPKRGVDYFTEADKEAIKDYINEQLQSKGE